MADRTYRIEISVDNLQESKSPIAGDNKQSDTEKGKGALTKKQAKDFGTAMVAYGKVKSFATQIINHEVSIVELRTGSRELQERANFTNQMVQTGVGILEGAVSGALVGGLPGFIAGTLLSVTHTVIGYTQKQDTLNAQRNLETASIAMNNIRAGANGSRRGQQ